MTISSAQIIKKIGCNRLSLYKGNGYWYFLYDDLDANSIYQEIPVFKLNHMSLDSWVAEGQEFVNYVNKMQKGKL